MSSATTTVRHENNKNNKDVSVDKSLSKIPLIIGLSCAFFSTGVVAGMMTVFRRENFKFKLKEQVSPALLGMRALGLGSLMCLGVFSAGIGVFTVSTGIHSGTQLEQFFTQKLKIFASPDSKLPKETDEKERQNREAIESFFNGMMFETSKDSPPPVSSSLIKKKEEIDN